MKYKLYKLAKEEASKAMRNVDRIMPGFKGKPRLRKAKKVEDYKMRGTGW